MSNMFLNVVSTFKGDGIQQANKQLSAFGKQTSSFGSILGKVGGALAAFGVSAKAIDFGKESITQARDLERNLFALDVIFGDLAPKMTQFTKDAEELGLSQSKAAKATTFIGSVLKQSGFEMDQVSVETEKLVKLGVDLAATYGYDVQEALLGMTALFRGEYDPIEKFGVAMKQAEINAVLAERGLNKLTGAELRNAEQTVRMELLYERAADAMGVFEAQSGSLYTEQKKLGASFENMQAQLGTALLPAIVDLNEELRLMLEESTPGLIVAFEGFAGILEGIIGVFRDAIDPTTELGESFAALGIQIESLANTLTGENVDFDIFEFGALVIRSVADALHDLYRFVENSIIVMQVLGEQMHALVTLDWDRFFGTDWNAEIKNRMDLATATKDFKLQSETAAQSVKDLRDSVAEADKAKLENLKQQLYGIQISAKESANEMRRFREQAGLPPIIPTGGTGGTGGKEDQETPAGGSAAKRRASLMQTLKQEAKKSRLAGRLISAGLSEGLAGQIVDRGPKAAKNQLKKIRETAGAHGKKLQKIYNRTAAGRAELDRINSANEAKLLAEQAKYDKIAEELRRKEEERLAEQKRVYDSFLDSVKSTFSGIKNAILGAFDITGLGSSTASITRNMEKMLVRLRSFSASIKNLATMGLDPALLQQIISMGPMAGAALASRLVEGGAGGLEAINAGYAEFGSLASEIATTGTNAMFGTEAQQNIYNINVSGGVGSGATIGQAIVEAIKAYERTSGAVWQGA
jgi:hypothetical protein